MSTGAVSDGVLIPSACRDRRGAVIAIRSDRVAAYQALVCDPTIDCAREPPEPVVEVAACFSGRCAAVMPL